MGADFQDVQLCSTNALFFRIFAPSSRQGLRARVDNPLCLAVSSPVFSAVTSGWPLFYHSICSFNQVFEKCLANIKQNGYLCPGVRDKERGETLFKESMEEFEFEKAVVELIEIEERTIPAGAFRRLTFRVKPRNWSQSWDHIITMSCTHPDLEKEARKAYDIWKGKQ